MDGGNNFIGQLDVDQLGASLRRDISTTVSGFPNSEALGSGSSTLVPALDGTATFETGVTSDSFSVSVRRSSLGETLIDDLILVQSAVGEYTVTVSSPGLLSSSFILTVSPGYPSSLDACGCSTCTRRITDGVCTDTAPYFADAIVSLRDVLVVTRDAGGALTGTGLEAEQERNISVELIFSKDQSTGIETPYSGNVSALSSSSQRSLVAKEGMVAWCANGTIERPAPRFCRPADQLSEQNLTAATQQYLNMLQITDVGSLTDNVTGTTGDGLEYYGIRSSPRWIGHTSGLHFNFPSTGVYKLQFSSFCPTSNCASALYRELRDDHLEIVVISGTPHRLHLFRAPPTRFENDLTISPAVQVQTLDIASNLCTNFDAFAISSVTPTVSRLEGDVTPLVSGVATFDRLKINGLRGNVYTLHFSVSSFGLSVSHTPFLVIPCEEVKSNSQSDGNGDCECMPGYTEDIRLPISGGTALTNLAPSVTSYPDLYKKASSAPQRYLSALNPYGVCVPCANGFYKPLPGPQACTSCPLQMDTMWRSGKIKGEWTTLSGEKIPGHLGNYRKNQCHCIVRRSGTSSDSSLETYRLLPEDEFRCQNCPFGGVCNGLPKRQIIVDFGRWRAHPDVTVVYDCLKKSACLGGESSTCAAGYTGNLCAVCADGYANPSIDGRNPPVCSKCPPNIAGGMIIVVHLLLHGIIVVTLFRIATHNHGGSVGLCKTILSHFQMMTVLKDVDLGWTSTQYLLFEIAARISTPTIHSFEIDCFLRWNHYQYTGYSSALPTVIAILAVFCYVVIRIVEIKRHRKTFFLNKFKLQEQVAFNRRLGKNVTDLQEALDKMSIQPDDTSPHGVMDVALTPRMTSPAEDEDKDIIRSRDIEVAELPATAYDTAVCLSLVMLYFSWTIILRHLLQLIRSRSFVDKGSFLFVDLDISTGTTLYTSWICGLVAFLSVYLVVLPCILLQALSSEKTRLHWRSVKMRLGFMFLGFMSEYWWWEFVVMIRKFGLLVRICSA